MGADTSELAHLATDLGRAPAKVAARAERDVDVALTGTQRDAEALAPVRTGLLRSRIGVRREGLTGEVFSDTDYDEYVEYGTSDTAAQPFMRPAAERNLSVLESRLGDSGESIL